MIIKIIGLPGSSKTTFAKELADRINAGAIASFWVVTKTILYYFHERGWNKVKWGGNNV